MKTQGPLAILPSSTATHVPRCVSIAACAAFSVVSGCAGGPVTRLSATSDPVPYTASYRILNGSDTLASEVASRCNGRIVGDNWSASPRGHAHYEARLDAKGFVNAMDIAIWRGEVGAADRPSQIVRFRLDGDTAVMESLEGMAWRVQRIGTARGLFPLRPDYVGLLDQLVRAGTNDGSDTVRVLLLGTGSNPIMARISRGAADTISLRLMEATLLARWTPENGILEGTYPGSSYRILRARLQGPDDAAERCGRAPFIVATPSPSAPPNR
jgi:hypothetical protein